ncbi:MAG: alanine/ornithine racemase family PLP-dependent enzyme [Thermoplasmata archaeon]|nr:alanine/ornithine racemase family PLP-dependent enzyme [Thermoplasmata archaeon]
MNPKLFIFLNKIEENARKLKHLLSKEGIDILGITKVMLGNPKYAEILIKSGITNIGDSRIQNITKMKKYGIDAKFFQIRAPQISEVEYTVKYADAAFVTEIETVKALSYYSKKLERKFGYLVMVEMGDLREGVMPEDLLQFVNESMKYGIEFLGIGTNLGCYGGVIPTREKIDELVQLKDLLEDHGISSKIVSGGATDTLQLFEKKELKGINQLRLGESIVLGRDTTGNREIEYLNRDTVILEAEIIEIKNKPSKPYGKIGHDAFGHVPEIPDIGIRRRAIIALGKQDVELESLIPLDNKIKILGGSGDHVILDITDSEENYKVGSVIKFNVLYPALLKLMTSPFVQKKFL